MKSNILIKGVFCNVLCSFYKEEVMLTGLGRKNWRGGFRSRASLQKGLKN